MKGNFLTDVSLQLFTTFGINHTVKYFATFSDVKQLKNLLEHAKSYNLPVKIIGGGSNILLTKNVEGIILKNEIFGKGVINETASHFIVKVGAGESWHAFTQWCVGQKYQGVENLSLIPGTVGAAPMQNIGAYGIEIKDVFHSLEALEIATGNVKTFSTNECNFGYRESVFKKELANQYVILSVTFMLNKTPKYHYNYGDLKTILEQQFGNIISAENIAKAVIQIRQSKLPDPLEIGNAGSFFKNPVIDSTLAKQLQKQYKDMPSYLVSDTQCKVPAGWLIEQCGWKGFTDGNCGVHAKQALVLVNYGGATGESIYNISTKIIESVVSKFGILLEREVNIW